MRLVLQRVSSAQVSVSGEMVGRCGPGFVALVGIKPGDDETLADKLAEKTANLRVFDDGQGKMNQSILDIGGSVLAVSQFTLYADCRGGRRPSFLGAAEPAIAERVYRQYVQALRSRGIAVETGKFGEVMMVEINNDGPVTIILDSDQL